MDSPPSSMNQDKRAAIALESGMDFLLQTDWLPARCDAARAVADVRERVVEACAGPLIHGEARESNYVERIAVCYGLLRAHEGNAHGAAPMWESLERIGAEVSPEFAELGGSALSVLSLIAELSAGKTAEPWDISERGFNALGRLWEGAFRAPRGFANYIARSLAGTLPADVNFFDAVLPYERTPLGIATFLGRMVDLLNTAITASSLPDSTVGERFGIGTWESFVTRVTLPVGLRRRQTLEVHCRRESISTNVHRIFLKLVDLDHKMAVGTIRGVVMSSDTGMYDEYVELSAGAGEEVENLVRTVFSPDDVVTIYPRVREFLDAAENQISRLMVIESAVIDRRWRARRIGEVLVRQLVIEAGDIDLVLGRPQAFKVDPKSISFGVMAGYAAARLRLARYWEQMGGKFMLHGTMGIPLHALLELRQLGEAERVN